MNFKKKHCRFTTLLLLGLVLVLTLGCVSAEAAPNWKLSDYRMITDGDDEYLVGGNTLYKRSKGRETELAKWNLSGKDYLAIISGYKNYIYISAIYMKIPITEDLYAVNYKTGKKVKVLSSFRPREAYGQYIYGYISDGHDSSRMPVYIWKASGTKVKKVRKLCDYSAGALPVVNKKIYFGTNPGGNNSVLYVYRSNLNGTGRKKLFTLKSDGGSLSLEKVEKNIITVTEHINQSEVKHEYNMKTGKLSKVS